MKKILITLVLSIALLSLTACAAKPLAKLTEDPITIDITEPIDVNAYLSDVKEGTEITYDLDEDNNHLVITLVNGDKTETLESDVTITYPRVDIPDDITIDTYTGYDINEIVDVDDDVTVTSELNEETGELTITYTKGEYTNTITKEVEVENSDPSTKTLVYECTNRQDDDFYEFSPDGTGIWHYYDNGEHLGDQNIKYYFTNETKTSGVYSYPGDDGKTYSWGFNMSEDRLTAETKVGNTWWGGADARLYCNLIEMK